MPRCNQLPSMVLKFGVWRKMSQRKMCIYLPRKDFGGFAGAHQVILYMANLEYFRFTWICLSDVYWLKLTKWNKADYLPKRIKCCTNEIAMVGTLGHRMFASVGVRIAFHMCGMNSFLQCFKQGIIYCRWQELGDHIQTRDRYCIKCLKHSI